MSDLDRLIARFEPGDPAFIGDPYPLLNELREATPVFWNERTGQWMLTRFADVSEALRHRGLGRDHTHRFSHADVGRPEPDGRWGRFHEHERWSLLCLEPPDHTRLRRLISKVFTPRSVTALEPAVTRLAHELADDCAERLVGDGQFDLIGHYAQPFSVAVICSMLGVPRHDTRLLLDWSHAIVKMYEMAASDDVKAAADRAAGEYIDYTRDLIGQKRRHPDNLLVSQLVAVEDAGDNLTEGEIVSTTMVLLEAGHEATVNTLGNGGRALLHHPDQWRRLVRGEVETRTAVEELLRYDAPLQMFERWVLDDDVRIAGRRLAPGDEVAMLFGAAQRDPRRFEDPDRFDVGRGDTGHIGFGGGIHFCVGAPLARTELAASLAVLVARFPDLTLVDEPTYHPTFVIRGLTGLQVTG